MLIVLDSIKRIARQINELGATIGKVFPDSGNGQLSVNTERPLQNA